MAVGYLLVITTTARGNIIVPDAEITIVGVDTTQKNTVMTDFEGKTIRIPLATVDKAETLKAENLKPYYSYHVNIRKPGYSTMTINDVHIFDGQTAFLPINLIPVGFNVEKAETERGDELPAVAKLTPPPVTPSPFVRTPIIPQSISVHLGVPGSNAPTVTVPFIDYIKNVASSEIYPTWPTEALRANIYAILSLTLNRVYTEWYRSRGYNYQITNSTALDQKYTPNGQVFDSISNIVDDIFNEYIVLKGHLEPLFAAYCDGRVIKECVGLKQWETVDLANQGMNALEILRRYYGDDLEITSTNRIQDIVDSYPGRPLQLGSTGNDVYTMQRYLNRISINYPNIPSIRPPNGIFDLRMEEAVRQFQKAFNLPVDGTIGKNTWYKIAFVYNGVRKLAELGQEGERLPAEDYRFRRVLREGARGEDVAILQTMLNIVAQFYDTVPVQKIDSHFGRSTEEAVRAYQQTFGIKEDGIVGRFTWNHLATKAQQLFASIPLRDELLQYPGYKLAEGDKGTDVRLMQAYLNEIALHYPGMPRVVVDGFFGKATTAQVKAFQTLFGITPDGIMGSYTWNKMLDVYSTVLKVVPYPGFLLKEGMSNPYVSTLQIYLNSLAKTYPSIPEVVVDEQFGSKTKQAVIAFQQQFGLTPDGIVGKNTWNKIIEVYLRTAESLSSSAMLERTIEAVSAMLQKQNK